MRSLIDFLIRKTHSLLGTNRLPELADHVNHLGQAHTFIQLQDYLLRNLFHNDRYVNSRRVTHFHNSVYSQNGEDGIIAEIFKRIGTTNQVFVEFGVHGVKNNSTFLLLQGWKGAWIGGDKNAQEKINRLFHSCMRNETLKYLNEWITPDNIEEIFARARVPHDFDFLSIDIDGNDYWVWKQLVQYRPRVVAIEYNATIPPTVKWVMSYNANHRWDQSSYFGASLKSLELLGASKGYKLVGCDFSGCNAFFVRDDLNLALFEHPFTAEHHYEPPRYPIKKPSGHKPGFGPFETV